MPKRRSEYKDLGQAEREKAIIEAVKTHSMASIDDVVHSVSERYELDLSENSAKEAFRKSIRSYLKKTADNGHLFGRAYFTKHQDHPRRVLSDDLERDQKGAPRNVYNIKYYLLGSDAHIPGGSIFISAGGLFQPHSNSSGDFEVDWEISKFKEIKPKHFYFIFQNEKMEFTSLRASLEDAPFNLIIGRGHSEGQYLPRTECLSSNYKRPNIFLWPQGSMSSPKSIDRPGHAIISLDSNFNISLKDFGSTNGTFHHPANESDVSRALDESLKMISNVRTPSLHNFLPQDREPSFREVKNIESTRQIQSPSLLKFGSFKMLVFVSN